MKVTHYTDQHGDFYREISDKNYDSMEALMKDYKKRGYKTWFNPGYLLRPGEKANFYILTVKVPQ